MTIGLAAALTGCGDSPESQLRKAREQKNSWEETSRLTAELSQQGALPAEYRRQLLEAVRKESARATQTIRELSQ
jgi:hypothetical protein